MTSHIDIHDLRSSLRCFSHQQPSLLEIRCDLTSSIHYLDLLELQMRFCGIQDWRWVDDYGHELPASALSSSLAHLFRDLLIAPFLYGQILTRLAFMRARVVPCKRRVLAPSVLFLRTDTWFHVKSGGSVGHLRGVIGSLRTLGYRTHVVSNDYLVGIPQDQDFHLCGPIDDVGRNLPVAQVFTYDDQVTRFVDAHWQQWLPAFVYQRYSLANTTGVRLKARYHVPYVCEYNGSFVWMARHWDNRKLKCEWLMNQVELLNLHAADLIVVNSKPMADELRGRGIDVGKILVNPNGVDERVYSPEVSAVKVRRQYKFETRIVIGFIGSFGPWHGVPVLVEAFGQLVHNYAEYRNQVCLLLIGDGQEMPQVKEMVAKFGIADICVLAGRVSQEQGPTHLAACDILVSPHIPNPDGTEFFGSPTKLFEYMAMGRGIVASDLGQIGTILKHDLTAWLVTPGDAEALMYGLKHLIDHPKLRRRLGLAARREAVEHYTWHEHTRKIVEKLKEICQ